MIRRLSDRDLYAYAARGLDPGDARTIEAAVAADPAAQGRLAFIEQRVSRLAASDARWRLPVLSIAGRMPPLAARAVSDLHMGEDGVHVGDRVVLRIAPPPDVARVRPLLLRECDGVSEVVYPMAPEEWMSLDQWPLEEGEYEIELVVDGPEGDQRYLVALVDLALEIDWTAPAETRWQAVRERIEEGTLAACAVVVHVDAGRPGAR